MSKEKFAQKYNIPIRTLTEFEAGRTIRPTIKTVKKLQKIYQDFCDDETMINQIYAVIDKLAPPTSTPKASLWQRFKAYISELEWFLNLI